MTSPQAIPTALVKVEFFLQQIERLLAGDFPHKDGKFALLEIRRQFRSLRDELKSFPATSSEATRNEFLGHLTSRIGSCTELLGIVLRSTHVRNAFEIFWPLKRMTIKILQDKDVQLLLSSEWDFVPFTYPMKLPSIPNLVIIGMPAPEAENALLLPLAGHEIAHSRWQKHDIHTRLNDELLNALDNSAQVDRSLTSEIEDIRGPLLAREWIRLHCSSPLLRKAEELFCDYLALHSFSESYIYAFHYLLFPGSTHFSNTHPGISLRIDFLKTASESLGITVSSDNFKGWTPQRGARTLPEKLCALTDGVIRSKIDYIISVFQDELDSLPIPRPEPEKVTAIEAALKKTLPFDGEAMLSEAVIAGWRVLLSKQSRGEEFVNDIYSINELLLKTIEVAEYHDRVNRHARCT